MNVLVASDKFKGSLTAAEACTAIETGLRNSFSPQVNIRSLPVADGGDGIARTLTEAKGGTWKTCTVRDALGDPIEAGYGLVDHGIVAVIEMAEASGLAHLAGRKLDPLGASTYGTGELILDAIANGAEQIILGIGGSATNDGGSGMAQALGFRFLDADGNEIMDIPASLPDAKSIELPADLDLPEILVACDVENRLLGPNGCTRIYGPQKGIAEAEFLAHEERLSHLVVLSGSDSERAALVPGSGAAGGLGFGGLVFLKGKLQPGFDLVSELLALESQISWADCVITGEGKLDRQTDEGKAPAGVGRLAREQGKPVYAFCGIREEGSGGLFEQVIEIRDRSLSVEENMATAAQRLQEAASCFAREFDEPCR